MKLTMAAEPHHNHAGEDAEHQLRDHGGHEKSDTFAAVIFEDNPIHKVTDDAREENHEGVDHTLYQGQGDHVAVGDVADFMGEHSLGFV